MKGTTTTDKTEWENSLKTNNTYVDFCGKVMQEIKSETESFLTFACTLPKDHQGDCILNLSWGDTEIELRKKKDE